MATSSSTTFGGPPSPLEKAIRDSSTNHNLKKQIRRLLSVEEKREKMQFIAQEIS